MRQCLRNKDISTRQVYLFTRHCENSIDPKKAKSIVDTHTDLQQPSHETEHEGSSSALTTIRGTYAYFGLPGCKKHEVEREVEPQKKRLGQFLHTNWPTHADLTSCQASYLIYTLDRFDSQPAQSVQHAHAWTGKNTHCHHLRVGPAERMQARRHCGEIIMIGCMPTRHVITMYGELVCM